MRYRLEKLFDLQMGKTPARANPDYWYGSNKWVSISDLSGYDKYVTDTKECISDLGVSESGIKAVPQNTVIMSFKLSIGKTAITTEDIYTNEAIMAFIDKGVCEIDTDYLYYLFSGMDWNKGTNKAVLGLTLNKATLSKKEIDIPDLHTQNEVVKKLDSLSNVIQLQKQSLDKLDELVKSRFVEMFGDFENLVNIWEQKSISDVTINYDNTRKPIKDSDRKKIQGKYPYYGATGIVDYLNDYRIDGTFLLVSEDGKALEFRNRDIAFVAKGKIWVNNHAHVLQCNRLINMIFLMYYINNRDISSWVTGIDQKKLNRENLDKMTVGVPPIDLQNRFADFVAQIEKQKTTVKMSLEKLETLKKSLMQEYFG